MAPDPTVPAGEIETLPFPVAYPLAFARDERLSAGDRLDNVLFTAYQAMRMMALLLLADYLDCETACGRLESAIRGLRMPHWNEWSVLCDQLCNFWNGRLGDAPDRPTRFPALALAWQDVNSSRRTPQWDTLLAGLPGIGGSGQDARSANEALWRARNDRAHRMGTHTGDDRADAAALARLLPLAEAMATCLFPPDGFSLLRRVGDGEPLQVFRLHGSHVDLQFEAEALPALTPDVFAASDMVALTPAHSVTVYPFFVVPDPETLRHPIGGGGLVEPVALVDGASERKVVLLGVRGNGESTALAAPLMAALARKRIGFGLARGETKRWTLVDWAATTARDTLNELLNRKYFPDCYLERAGIDDRVERCLAAPGRGLLLLGEAGSGKTSLLARLVDRLTAEPGRAEPAASGALAGDAVQYLDSRGAGDVVLFLSGRQAYAGDARLSGRELLCEAVARRAGVRSGEFAGLEEFAARLEQTAAQDTERERLVWIVLDALNEANRFTDLVQALDAFLPALGKYPWLRLVVSLRTGAYQSLTTRHRDLGQHGSAVFANAGFWLPFSDERSGEVVPYLAVRPFAGEEGASAYRLRQEHFPERSCAVGYDRLSPSLRQLILSPLHLHLFHETFRGVTAAPSVDDEASLFEAYLDQLAGELPQLRDTLPRIGKLLYEQRRPDLPADIADEWLAQWRAAQGFSSAAAVVKLDPIEELVAASVLMRPAEEGFGVDRHLVAFQFTHQRLCEQVLLRELLRQIAPRELPNGAELLGWAQHAAADNSGAQAEFSELTGALETMAARLAGQGKGADLASLLDLEDERVRTRILGAAIRSLGPLVRSTAGQAAASTLNELTSAAAGVQRGRHLYMSAWPAQQWLQRCGYGSTATALLSALVRLLRLLVAAEPQRADLRRDLSAHLNDLGRIDERMGKGSEALRSYGESLEVLRALVVAEPQRIDLLRELSVSLNHLGRLMEVMGNSSSALRLYEESLHLRWQLVATEPQRADLRRDLSVSLNNRGRLAEAVGHGGEARCFYEESLQVMRELVAAEPRCADLRRELSVSLNNLGRLAEAAGNGSAAQRYYEESLQIMRELVAAEPQRADLRRQLSVSLSALGGFTQDSGSGGEARQLYEESLQVMRELVAAEPQRADLRRELSVSMSNLGQCAKAAGRLEEAKSFYEEDLENVRELLTVEPQRADLQRDLSVSLSNLGQVLELTGDRRGAQRLYYESLQVMRALAGAEPGRADLRRELSVHLSNMGRSIEHSDKDSEAQPFYEESLQILRELVRAEPNRGDLRHELSVALNNLGRLVERSGKGREAQRLYEESAQVIRTLVVEAPQRCDLRRDLSASLNKLGRFAERSGNSSEAVSLYQESMELMRELVAAEPQGTDLRHDLSVSLSNVARLAEDAGSVDEARRFYEESQQVMRELVAAEPQRTDLRHDLSVSLNNVGRLAEDAGRVDDAGHLYGESERMMRELVATEPQRTDLRCSLTVSINNVGRMAENAGEIEEARRCYAESVSITRECVASEPRRSDLRHGLSIGLNNLGMLAVRASNTNEARAYFGESFQLLRALVAAEPERADFTGDFAITSWNLARVTPDAAERRACLLEIVERLQPLQGRGALPEQLEQLWSLARSALGQD